VGFVKGRRMMDHYFKIKTSVDKYLRKKRGRIYLYFVDFGKAFDFTNGETLWFEI
jgi:hypothetical protein